MDRRRFLLTSLAGAVAVPLAGEAQQPPSLPRVGFLAQNGRYVTDDHDPDRYGTGSMNVLGLNEEEPWQT